jgi:hypothetical protein
VIPNAVGADGTVRIYSPTAAQLIVDVNRAF